MPETTPLIKAALNLRVGAGFDVYERYAKDEQELPILFMSNHRQKGAT